MILEVGLKGCNVLTKFFSVNEAAYRLQNKDLIAFEKNLLLEAATSWMTFYDRLREMNPDLSEADILKSLSERFSPESLERILKTNLINAALAPTSGKLNMLTCFGSYILMPGVTIDLVSKLGSIIAGMDPLDGLLLRGVCFAKPLIRPPESKDDPQDKYTTFSASVDESIREVLACVKIIDPFIHDRSELHYLNDKFSNIGLYTQNWMPVIEDPFIVELDQKLKEALNEDWYFYLAYPCVSLAGFRVAEAMLGMNENDFMV